MLRGAQLARDFLPYPTRGAKTPDPHREGVAYHHLGDPAPPKAKVFTPTRPASLLVLPFLLLAQSASAQVPVTVDTFIRAETDQYLQKHANDGFFSKIAPIRGMVPLDNQPAVLEHPD